MSWIFHGICVPLQREFLFHRYKSIKVDFPTFVSADVGFLFRKERSCFSGNSVKLRMKTQKISSFLKKQNFHTRKSEKLRMETQKNLIFLEKAEFSYKKV